MPFSRRAIYACLLVFLSLSALPASKYAIVEGHKASPLERFASLELKRYLYLLSGEHVPIIKDNNLVKRYENLFILGTPQSNSLLKKIALPALSQEGFLIKTLNDKNATNLFLVGKTPIGVLYAVYTLLEELGVLFTFAGDFLPPQKPFVIPNLNKTYNPVFSIRGTLPWFNFFDSPTAWNLEDYKSYIDQLSKQKLNFLGFHSYDFEPFCAYYWEGKLVAGEPLANTSRPNWGTHPMRTSEFGFGTDAYFAEEFFGAEASFYRTREEGILKAQALLREAFNYAKSKGIKVCLGFEVSGDPTDPVEQKKLEARLRHLIQTYPMLDYIWIWEPEGWAVNGYTPPSPRSSLGSYYRRWERIFSYLSEPKRITEAVRMTLYALQAHRILRSIAPSVKLIVSGWGGDRWLRFSDFYLGMDKILPQDIVFSALDNINPTDDVASVYGQLSPQRVKVPIPWWEFDGDQWFPQPWNPRYENLCKDALKKGCQGLLAIHWRTRGIEETASFFSRFPWHPTLSFEEFYAYYAERLFGGKEKNGREIASLLMELQKLGYRWIGGGGQPECGTFSWSPGEQDKVERLEKLREEMLKVRENLPTWAKERLQYYINIADWALLYHRSATAMLQVENLLREMRFAKASGDGEKARSLARRALSLLPLEPLGQALRKYASNMGSRGEWGVLATINTKAFWDLREKVREIQEVLGESVSLPVPSPPQFECLMPLFPSTLAPGEPLPVSLVAQGESNVEEVKVFYKGLAEKGWQSISLKKARGNVFKGALLTPKEEGTLLWFIEIKDGQGRGYTYPTHQPQRLFSATIWRRRVVETSKPSTPLKGRKEKHPPEAPSFLRAELGTYAVRLHWREGEDTAVLRYKIYRFDDEGEKFLGEVMDTYYEDLSVQGDRTYRYRVIGVDAEGRSGSKFAEVVVKTPSFPPPPPPLDVRAEGIPGGVMLTWSPVGSRTDIIGYRVERRREGEDFHTSEGGDLVPADSLSPHIFVDRTPAGKVVFYRVRAISPTGQPGEPSSIVSAQPLAVPIQPFLTLSFNGNPSPLPEGEVFSPSPLQFSPLGIGGSLFLSAGSWVGYRLKKFYPSVGLTIELWMRAESLEGMPILVSQGIWRQEGYFLQILGGQIRFSIAGVGDLDSNFRPQIGRWYYLVATYDGRRMRLFVNGQVVAEQEGRGPLRPSQGLVFIGRYQLEDPVYLFHGYIDEVRLYPFALEEEEIKEHYHKERCLLKE